MLKQITEFSDLVGLKIINFRNRYDTLYLVFGDTDTGTNTDIPVSFAILQGSIGYENDSQLELLSDFNMQALYSDLKDLGIATQADIDPVIKEMEEAEIRREIRQLEHLKAKYQDFKQKFKILMGNYENYYAQSIYIDGFFYSDGIIRSEFSKAAHFNNFKTKCYSYYKDEASLKADILKFYPNAEII